MPVDILLTVIFTSLIQSVFGVGVLLFGTPILLLLGYDFISALTLLLPISIAINLLQIIKHYPQIDTVFYKKILIYSLPFIIVFLIIVSTAQININLIIGLFLTLVAVKSFFPVIAKQLEKMVRYEKTALMLMGAIHGLTNLGGSLLTAIVHTKNYSKDTARVTIASGYASFAFVQLLTLSFINSPSEFNYSVHIHLLQIGVIVFLLAEEIIYQTINNQKYQQLFAVFLFVSGLLLIVK